MGKIIRNHVLLQMFVTVANFLPSLFDRCRCGICCKDDTCMSTSAPFAFGDHAPLGEAVPRCMAATDSIWSYGMCDESAGDRYISYLPLAHIYERVVMTSVTYRAMSVGFYRSVLCMKYCVTPASHRRQCCQHLETICSTLCSMWCSLLYAS